MNKVFIGGSRLINRLNADVTQRLERIVARQLSVLIGDASGVDQAVQTYFSACQYPHVTVYCTGQQCRNNVAGWPIISVPPPHHTHDFQFFTAKDAAMARDAEVGLMIWDGQSRGTLVNVTRLVAARKPVVVYVSARRDFVTVKVQAELMALFSQCPPHVRQRLDQYLWA